MEKQIFITMDGGLIQDISVSADMEDVEITVIDLDIEGCEEQYIITLPDEQQQAMVWKQYFQMIDDGDVEHFEEIIKRRDDEPGSTNNGV